MVPRSDTMVLLSETQNTDLSLIRSFGQTYYNYKSKKKLTTQEDSSTFK